MSSSVFRDSDPINSSEQEDTLVILVNEDGTVSAGQNTLHTLLADRSRTASLSIVRVNPPSPLPEDADVDGDDNGDLIKERNIPRVNLTVSNYFTPEETQKIAADIMNYTSDIPAVEQPLSVKDTEFQLYVIRNDHCYTTLTSPSQKLPLRPSSPSGYPDPEDLEEEDAQRAQIQNEVEQDLPRFETPKNKIIKARKTSISNNSNIKTRELKGLSKGGTAILNNVPESIQSGSNSVVPVISRYLTKENEKTANQVEQSTSDLQSVLEDENEYDSDQIPTSDSESPDHDSDADFKLDERRSSRSKKPTRNNQRNVLRGTKHSSIKKKFKKKQILSTSDMEMESMLQEMDGPTPTKVIRRKSSSKIVTVSKRLMKGKLVRGNKTLKTLNSDKILNMPVESAVKLITKPEPKPPSPEPIKVEEAKPIPKIPPKKDKKPPAHVTEALFSDMTALFSTPDIIKKVPSSNKISDQRKSIDRASDSTMSPVKKSPHMLEERRKSSKDSTTSDNYSTTSQIKDGTFTEHDSVKQLEIFNSIVTSGFSGVDSTSLAVAALDNLPNLASILQSSNASECDTAIDEATLLNNVVGVNLLDTKLPNVLDPVSINTLTNDIPDPGPLSAVSTGSLDLEDNALLENLHNEEGLSEDFLMHVAQQLADNSDLQEVLDKQVLGNQSLLNTAASTAPIPAIPSVNRAPKPKPTESPFVKLAQQKLASKEAAMANLHRKEPIKIVRSDGRVITLPPIEAPATRSKRRSMAASTVTSASVVTTPTALSKQSKIEPQIPAKKQTPVDLPRDVPDAVRRRSRNSSEQSTIRAPSTPGDDEDSEDDKSEDDPDRLWCICKQPHNNRFMICCDTCEDWFHGKCVNVTKALGHQMEEKGEEWTCPNCARMKAQAGKKNTKGGPSRELVNKIIEEAVEDESHAQLSSAPDEKLSVSSGTNCIVCKQEARNSSIYCSDVCIIKHARESNTTAPPANQLKNSTQKVPGLQAKPKNDRVIVFERATGRFLAGPSAPTASNLKQWLQANPTFEVVRPGTHPVISTKKPAPQVNKVTTQQKPVGSVGPQPNNKTIKTTNLKTAPKQIILVQPPKILSHGSKATPPTQVKQVPAITKAAPQKPGNQKASTSSGVQSIKAPQTPPAKPQTPKSKHPAPEPIRLNVRKTLKEQLHLRVSESIDSKLSPEEVGKFSQETELELFNMFRDTGAKYKAKYRSLLFNIKDKKNLTLFKKICDGSITPKQLVRLSPDELASQELAQWREKEAKHQLEMIKKSELDLLACAKTYVLKTHKGEEVIENRISDMGGVDPNVSVEDVVTALNNSAVSSSSEVQPSPHTTHVTKDKKHKAKRDRSRSRDKHDRSRSRDKDHRSKGKSEKKSSHREKSSSHRSKSKEKDRERGRERDSDKHSKRRDKDKKDTRDRDRSRSRDKRGSKDKDSESKRESSRRSDRSKSDYKAKHKDNKDTMKERDNKNDKDIKEKEKESTSTLLSENKSIELLELRENIHVEELPMQDLSKQIVAESSHMSPEDDLKGARDSKPENELDQEPTSTVIIGTPENSSHADESLNIIEETNVLVWTGVINMIDVAQFSISAVELAGDASELSRDLPSNIDIVGRIGANTVWEYISKMKNSCTKDIVVIKLIAASEEENIPYIALFSYLHSRQRLGVIKNNSAAIKDFYIYPLNSTDRVPDILLPFNKPFDEAAPRPHTLLGIIVRSRKKRTGMQASLSSAVPIPLKISRRVATPPRSYTPPVNMDDVGYTPPSSPRHSKKDRFKLSHLSTSVKEKIAASLSTDDLEPYSPGGSDSGEEKTKSSLSFDNLLPAAVTKTELEQEMDELNRKIEERRKQIQNISGFIIANSDDSEIKDDEPYSPSRPVSPAPQSIPLANISIPSNLQEILASIQRTSAPAAPPKNPYLISDPVEPADDEYTPTSYSSKKIESYIPGPSKLALSTNLGISQLDIIPGVNDDSNTNFIEKSYMSENVSDPKVPFYTQDIDERLVYNMARDIDERVKFPVGSKDVDERIIPLVNINKTEAPMPPSMSPPLLPPPPPNISNIHPGEIRKSYNTTSKLAQLSEEELLSMVPDEALSPIKTVSDKMSLSHTKEKRNVRGLPIPPSPPVIAQGPVMYTQIGKRPIKDVQSAIPSLPDLTSPPPAIPNLVVQPQLKKLKLEQPPPPGMEDFLD